MTTGVEPRRFAYIDALRGYAILMVIAVHASLFYNLPPTQLALAALGARGVQLFFVASAMTLFMSWHSRNDGAKAFYIRRFFRIAPMYYLCLPIFLYFDGFGPTIYAPDGLSIRHILMALTFTHGFMPDTLNSVVPGSWSIADEMIFYAIFPLLIAIRVRWLMAAALTLLATVVCVKIQQTVQPTVWAMPDTPWRVTWGTYYDLWFVNQLPCFLFGLLVAQWLQEGRTVRYPAIFVIGAACAAVWIALYPPNDVRFIRELSAIMQYGAIFAIFALGLSAWQPKVLVNPVICWIGKVSYSGYLVHILLISAAGVVPVPHETYPETFGYMVVVTIAISSITYLAIEKPLNRIGHRLSRWKVSDTVAFIPADRTATVAASE